MNLTAGTTLQNGKYVLEHPLGQRGLGITLKATQPRSHQAVVLKTLQPQPQMDVAHLRQRFMDDARQFSQCQHPGLVRVLDVFEEAGLPFAVMDYVAGQTLAERVQSHGALPEARAIQYIRQVGSALSVIHRHGLVHQDVKPENLIRPKGADFVVLVDFSIAHHALSDVLSKQQKSPSPYAAIEQFQAPENLKAATDIYALAATLYFLVTGQAPIAAPLRQQSLLTPPRQIQPLSAVTEYAILSGMATNPQERPQTIAAWFALLPDSNPLPAVHEFSGSVGQPATPIMPPPPASTNGTGRPTAPPQMTSAPSTQAAMPKTPRQIASVAPKSRLPKALTVTSAIAIAAGLGLGLALRLSAVSGIGPVFFQTKQDFPPVQNWPLQADPIDSSTPTVSPLAAPPPVQSELAPVRPSKIRFSPSPSPTPREPVPSPNATIAPSPLPSPLPGEPVVPPSPLPNPSPPANSLPPRATPPVQTPVNPLRSP